MGEQNVIGGKENFGEGVVKGFLTLEDIME